MPETKACSAADTSWVDAAWGRCVAVSRAEPNDVRAADWSAGERWAMAVVIPELYLDAATLPSTATPRAAPSSRVASFIAEPAPARRGGTADMIAAVIGDMVSAIPHIRKKTHSNT